MENYAARLQSSFDAIHQMEREKAIRHREAEDAQILLPHLLSGHAMFAAMKRAVDDLVGRAPQDHDVLIQIGDLSVLEAQFIEPHSFLFEGVDQNGHRAGIVCHFTQVIVKVVYRPKRSAERVVSRVIQGFSPHEPSA